MTSTGNNEVTKWVFSYQTDFDSITKYYLIEPCNMFGTMQFLLKCFFDKGLGEFGKQNSHKSTSVNRTQFYITFYEMDEEGRMN